MAALTVGDKAPAFALKDQDGKNVKLSQFKGKNVVVYFYPKADTPGCTTQSCNLRDAFPQLKKLKAAVVGETTKKTEKSCARIFSIFGAGAGASNRRRATLSRQPSR